ncbi:META domain-containing protein [Streptomyces tagetis]|uniref:META domain-containing protein n=1 Tax=Streptomyces tagetis TaxID=2820809 RepID=A0A940XK28_9ACTN|nr:META domain-containing protein [Streptomyces sp. RG38]MBQ0827901.1 META domain-containing protein [Streptomyces sp. RG38]
MDRKRQRTTLTVAAVAALVPLVAACGSRPAPAGSAGADRPLTGVDWSVDSVTADGTTHRAPDGARVRIGEDGTAEGSLGCNRFTARADLSEGRIRLSEVTSTEMACENTSTEFEGTLSRTLTQGPLTPRAEDGGGLTLTTPAGDTVRLSEERGGGTAAAGLRGNHVRAGATVRDGHITLGRASTTRMMCEDSLMDTEKRLTSLFDGGAAHRVDQRNSPLTSQNGAVVRAGARG